MCRGHPDRRHSLREHGRTGGVPDWADPPDRADRHRGRGSPEVAGPGLLRAGPCRRPWCWDLRTVPRMGCGGRGDRGCRPDLSASCNLGAWVWARNGDCPGVPRQACVRARPTSLHAAENAEPATGATSGSSYVAGLAAAPTSAQCATALPQPCARQRSRRPTRRYRLPGAAIHRPRAWPPRRPATRSPLGRDQSGLGCGFWLWPNCAPRPPFGDSDEDLHDLARYRRKSPLWFRTAMARGLARAHALPRSINRRSGK